MQLRERMFFSLLLIKLCFNVNQGISSIALAHAIVKQVLLLLKLNFRTSTDAGHKKV
ncbi:hypothetical protein GCM10027037_17500 [Mucilaginibacter koreensis]